MPIGPIFTFAHLIPRCPCSLKGMRKLTMAIAAVAAALGLGGAGFSAHSSAASTAPPTSWSQAIAYTQTRPAFTPTKTIYVTTASQLKSAVANLTAGELVKATAPFTVSSSTGAALNITKHLSSYAEIDLGSYVTIKYTGTSNQSAVYLHNPSHILIFGGIITSPTGGGCIVAHGATYITWWGFTSKYCGMDGFSMFTASDGGPFSNNDIEGDISHTGLEAQKYDPHFEKCTGTHGANLQDSGYYPFTNNRIALNVHDSSCIGGGIEFGVGKSTAADIPNHNTIILQCSNFTYAAKYQTGSNCYQVWGYGAYNTDFKFVNATNIYGYAYWAGGMSGNASSTSLSTDTVEYGRATQTNLHPHPAGSNPWSKKDGTVFLDVLPKP